ncbi:MAG: right-handed parallel beta-helix repeat-containing protein [Planctomycetes bacterium]|nr:right-handed parallel beta-helix repeat-containing protein [Planctomycetota bacterium]
MFFPIVDFAMNANSWSLAPLAAIFFCSFLHSRASADILVVPKDHPTIQEAINAAGPGDVVVVRPGIYSGKFQITGKTQITVRAAGKVIVAASGPAPGISIVGSSQIILRGFWVKEGPNHGIAIEDSTAITVDRCRTSHVGGDGVRITDSTGVLVDRFEMKRPNGCGIRLVSDGTVTSGCLVKRGRILHPGSDGVLIEGDSNLVERCWISEAQEDGLEVAAGSSSNTLSKCTVKDALRSGIRLDGAQTTVSTMFLLEPGDTGIEIFSDNHSISKVILKKPGDDGVRLNPGSEGNTLDRCSVVRPAGDGFDVEGNSNTMLQCRSIGAGDRGFEVTSTGNILSSCLAILSEGFDLFDSTPAGSNTYSSNLFKKVGP